MPPRPNETLELAAQLAAVSQQLVDLTRKLAEQAIASAVAQPISMPGLLDHREIVISQVAYSTQDVARLLGVSYYAAQRLVTAGAIKSRNTGARYIVSGAAIRDYLDGADEPMKHPESA